MWSPAWNFLLDRKVVVKRLNQNGNLEGMQDYPLQVNPFIKNTKTDSSTETIYFELKK